MTNGISIFLNRSLAALLLACGLMTGLAACNTVEGVGQDVEATGDAISDAAKDASD